MSCKNCGHEPQPNLVDDMEANCDCYCHPWNWIEDEDQEPDKDFEDDNY